MANKLLLTAEEAAESLGVGRTTVFGLIKDGQLKTVRIGRARRIPTTSLEDYIKRLTADWS